MPCYFLILLVCACGRIGFEGTTGDARAQDGDGLSDVLVDAPVIPSCATLTEMCGPGANESCCASPLVPGGTFYRGYDLGGDGMFVDMSHPATLSSFRFDRFEVTVERFRQFVDAGQGTRQNPPVAGAGAQPNLAGSGWNSAWNTSLAADTTALRTALTCDSTWTDTPGANDKRPVACITWYEAMAFCAWDGGFLPTEAQWHFAASGGAAQRAYPWTQVAGDVTLDCNHANYTACATPVHDVGTISPAGDGIWGQSDLAGNAMEWVLDWFGTYPDPCTDCANLTVSSGRIGRGGATFDTADHVRAASRYHMGSPSGRVGAVGVRCARRP